MSEKSFNEMSGPMRRNERARKEQLERRKVRVTAISVVVVLALLFAGALFLNSKYIRRSFTAITVGDTKYSAAEYDYFFNNAYYEYYEMIYNSAPEYASSLLPQSGVPLRSQIYNNETGETWADFIAKIADEKIIETTQYYQAALENGFTLPDEERATFEEEIAGLRASTQLYGYNSFTKYIQSMYGSSMDEKSFLKIAELAFTANAYSRQVYNSFEYSDEQLTEKYAENVDTLDYFKHRYFLVNTDKPSEEDFESTEDYEAALAAAMEETRVKAEAIAAGIETEEDFIAAALEYDAEAYAEPDSTLRTYQGDLLGGTYGPWLRDTARETGDTDALILENNGYYIVQFLERTNNDYEMASMRQILITPKTVDEALYEDDEAYQAAVAEEEAAATALAESVLVLFEEGGATEEKLLELMEEHSEDTTEGGFYENIHKLNSSSGMVPEIDEWLFEPGRKIGDYKLIKSEAYGYHLVYFMGYGQYYDDFLAENLLREEDFNAWKESLSPLEIAKKWAFTLTIS